jgi:hypothetical protein
MFTPAQGESQHSTAFVNEPRAEQHFRRMPDLNVKIRTEQGSGRKETTILASTAGEAFGAGMINPA